MTDQPEFTTDRFPRPEFTEDEMLALDRATVRAYLLASGTLPPHMRSERRGDPAAIIRAWVYDYAYRNPARIHGRVPGEIFLHVRKRATQHIKRETEKVRQEQPWGIDLLDFAAIKAGDRTRVSEPAHRPDSPTSHRSLDLYGRILPADRMQFVVKASRNGKRVFEDPAVIAKLHTRKPTRMEFWNEVCGEWDREGFRKQIAASFAAGICDCTDC